MDEEWPFPSSFDEDSDKSSVIEVKIDEKLVNPVEVNSVQDESEIDIAISNPTTVTSMEVNTTGVKSLTLVRLETNEGENEIQESKVNVSQSVNQYVRPSVRMSVGRSICPSVCLSLCLPSRQVYLLFVLIVLCHDLYMMIYFSDFFPWWKWFDQYWYLFFIAETIEEDLSEAKY